MKIIRTCLLFCTLFCVVSTVKSQEKKQYLQQRFDVFFETIDKNTSNKRLTLIKDDFKTTDIIFHFSKLKRNSKNEIIHIVLKLKNKHSSASLILNNNNKPIPTVKIGEANNIVSIKTVPIFKNNK